MSNVSAFGIFCDDVREEKSGSMTIVGAMLDNVELPGFPGFLAKLSIYTKIVLPIDAPIHAAQIYLTMPDGSRQLVAQVSEDMIRKAIDDVRDNGGERAGIISHMMAAPFQIPKPCRVMADMDYGDQNLFLGAVNFTQAIPLNG